MADRNGGSGFAIGLLVGAALGLAVGFLFAPQSGKETRQMLRDKAEAARERATEVSKKVRETAAGAAKRVQTKLE
jgi:gas vesicle protein